MIRVGRREGPTEKDFWGRLSYPVLTWLPCFPGGDTSDTNKYLLYSTLRLASLMTLLQRVISVLMNSANCSGVLDTGSNSTF